MLYGHRNDVEGYAQALEAVDNWLPSLMAAMQKGDLLILCADHGNDPTTASTDHDREYVPLLVYGGIPVDLGTRQSLADIGQTVAANFGCSITHGTSFLPDISRAGRRTRKS
jgi:phosphopentomutase